MNAQLILVKHSLSNYLNLDKTSLRFLKKNYTKIYKYQPSNVSSQLNSNGCIDLILNVLNKAETSELASNNNIDLTSNMLFSKIYNETSIKKKDLSDDFTNEQEYYSEQFKLIDDILKGGLLKIPNEEQLDSETQNKEKEEENEEANEDRDEESSAERLNDNKFKKQKDQNNYSNHRNYTKKSMKKGQED